jgi:cytochrome c peroxidase
MKGYLMSIVTAAALVTGCSADPGPAFSEETLGEKLFFDPVLSRDSTISCSSCHKPEFAFADTVRLSRGMGGRTGMRNTPTAMNQSERNAYFWDGRAATLEEQALGPMEAHVEMDFPLYLTVRRLRNHPVYRRAFRSLYNSEPTAALLARAIAAYERTLETSDSPFDRYMKQKDTTNFGASEQRGLAIFNTKARCFDCHFGVDFTGGDQFRNIGLYNGKTLYDAGRFEVSKDPKDLGRFKVPGLRNIAQTPPYMHNGMFRTLSEVIEYYNEPDKFVPDAVNRDSLLRKPLGLTAAEMKDLKNFLLALSDDRFTAGKAHDQVIAGKN